MYSLTSFFIITESKHFVSSVSLVFISPKKDVKQYHCTIITVMSMPQTFLIVFETSYIFISFNKSQLSWHYDESDKCIYHFVDFIYPT